MRRGIALASVLLLTSVLAIMAISLILVTRRQSLGAVDHYHRTCALNAAESGLARALKELTAVPGWDDGYLKEPMPSGRGSYTVTFAPPSGPVGPDDSVNNLNNPNPTAGPRGDTGVPPRTAVLIVIGESSGVRTRLEAVVGRQSFAGLPAPVLATGPIVMRGGVSIDGRESLEGAAVDAGLHTNYAASGADKSISWAPIAGADQAVISGAVTTSDPRPVGQAIEFLGSHSVGSTDSNAPTRPLPNYDIPGLVDANSSGANPGPLNNGTNILAAGKYHVAGPISVAGDLELQDGAELYVDGDLDVNGAIRGKGTVVVNGSTHLRGDSQLGANNRLALLSEGDIHLEGFDGQAYLEALPGGAPLLSQINQTLSDISYWSEHSTGPFPTGFSSVLGGYQILDRLNHELADHTMSHPSFNAGVPQNRLGALRDLVNAQPPSSARDFLSKKLTELHRYHGHGSIPNKTANALAFLANPSTGIAEAVESLTDNYASLTSAQRDQGLKLFGQIARSVSYDKLGTSNFQGLVYTQGDFRATNQVTIVGALVANGKPGKGRISLENGTSVTYIRDFFEAGGGLEVAGQLQVRTWAGR